VSQSLKNNFVNSNYATIATHYASEALTITLVTQTMVSVLEKQIKYFENAIESNESNAKNSLWQQTLLATS